MLLTERTSSINPRDSAETQGGVNVNHQASLQREVSTFGGPSCVALRGRSGPACATEPTPNQTTSRYDLAVWWLPCRIASSVPEDPTEFVDAEVVDAQGKVWKFRDKLAVFRERRKGRGAGDDGIRCVLTRLGRVEGRVAYWASTASPDDVAPVDSEETEFVTFEARYSSHPRDHEDALARIPRESGLIHIDVLQHTIAIALGVLPQGTHFNDAKPFYWTARDDVGDFTLKVLTMLVCRGELLEDPDDPTLLSWATR